MLDRLPPQLGAARLGLGYELDAIAAVVIGGTSLSGGEGTILGTVIGAFIISTLTNGLRIMSVPQEWQIVVTGVIVIVAVYLDIIRRRSSSSTNDDRSPFGFASSVAGQRRAVKRLATR